MIHAKRSSLARGIAAASLAALLGMFLISATPVTAQEDAKIDINKATVEELLAVRGIGRAIAQRIVEFREKNGPYSSVDELLKVQGIGEKSLERIKDRLTAGKVRK